MALQTAAEIEATIEATGGETVVFGGVTTYGHVDYGDEEALEDGQVMTIVRVRTVLVATGILSSVDRGETIVVDGTTYVITDHRAEGDGLETRLWLGDNA